eukprot:2171715-Pleurochrysis_carterae.AAC.1
MALQLTGEISHRSGSLWKNQTSPVGVRRLPCAGCEAVRIHAQRMEISRLTSGTSFASGLLLHFCSHALAVKRGGSRAAIKPATGRNHTGRATG